MVKIYKQVHYPGLVVSRQKNGRDSQSCETDGGEKIAATNAKAIIVFKVLAVKNRGPFGLGDTYIK